MPKEKEVISVLKEIIDPHTRMSVYDMGLISEIKVSKSSVSLIFRPTSPFCPMASNLAGNIKRRLMQLKGIEKANVKVVCHVYEEMINHSLNDN